MSVAQSAAENLATNIEVSTDESVFASLGLNPQLFLFQLLNLAIVIAIVWFLILRPLTKKLEERRRIIDESLDQAKEAETALQMSEQKYQERIDDAKAEANKVVAKAQAGGEQVVVQMKEKAKKEIELLVNQAKRNIAIEKEDMRSAVRKDAAELIIAALQKILPEEMTKETDRKLIEQAVEELKK